MSCSYYTKSMLSKIFIQMKIKKNINYESDFHQMDESEQLIENLGWIGK